MVPAGGLAEIRDVGFSRMCATWRFTVCGLSVNSRAMCLLLRPRAINPSTSLSRALSGSWGAEPSRPASASNGAPIACPAWADQALSTACSSAASNLSQEGAGKFAQRGECEQRAPRAIGDLRQHRSQPRGRSGCVAAVQAQQGQSDAQLVGQAEEIARLLVRQRLGPQRLRLGATSFEPGQAALQADHRLQLQRRGPRGFTAWICAIRASASRSSSGSPHAMATRPIRFE